ncbi:hypothetical protein BRC97_01295 [Halobacteriales archaeon QS_6_71_20]|nr:MAG: hypothetical protein BRC97_01295 [Halobacteriales archaeon QS_6_71_20]
MGGSFDSGSEGSPFVSGAVTSTYSVSLRVAPSSSVTVSVTSYRPTAVGVNVVDEAAGSSGRIVSPAGVRIDHS